MIIILATIRFFCVFSTRFCYWHKQKFYLLQTQGPHLIFTSVFVTETSG